MGDAPGFIAELPRLSKVPRIVKVVGVPVVGESTLHLITGLELILIDVVVARVALKVPLAVVWVHRSSKEGHGDLEDVRGEEHRSSRCMPRKGPDDGQG